MAVWDRETARRYEEWHKSPEGSYALAAELRLIEVMTSPWPRRNQRLLEVGCGTGMFLRAMWEAGFDVTGLDGSPAMLEVARERLGSRADLHVGRAERLPFHDREFDYVMLLTVLEFCDDPVVAMREAARVARKGLLVGYLNRVSFYYLLRGLRLPMQGRSLLREASWFSPWRMRSLIWSALGERSVRTRSVLPGPPSTWRDSRPLNWLNSRILPPGCGAYVASSIDLMGGKCLTPLFLWKTQPKPTS